MGFFPRKAHAPLVWHLESYLTPNPGQCTPGPRDGTIKGYGGCKPTVTLSKQRKKKLPRGAMPDEERFP